MSGADLPASFESSPPNPDRHHDVTEDGVLARLAAKFTHFAERWVPDAYVFALLATVFVFVLAVVRTEATTQDVAVAWGSGFWGLLSFTMQMSLIIITGYVVATSGPVNALIAAMASFPKKAKGAVAMVAFVAMTSAWINWGFGLIFTAMLAKEIARKHTRVDYRALAAASFLGLGSIWAQGLSGSAALQMATPTSMEGWMRDLVRGGGAVPQGVIPLSKTIFLWQSIASVLVEIVLVTALMYAAAPNEQRARSASDMGISLGESPHHRPLPERRGTPGDWLEHGPVLSFSFVALSTFYLVSHFRRAPSVLGALTLDTINLAFLTIGVALHRTPARLMRAVREATPGVWAVILQFPLYAGIASIVVKTRLNEQIARLFVDVSTPLTFPACVAIYSAALGVLVPSGGSKWVIEAPYVLKAAHMHQAHLGWVVAVYDLGEALANLIQPFWMLPILGLFGLRARDVMGYTFLVFLVLAPVVLVLVTVLGATLRYPL